MDKEKITLMVKATINPEEMESFNAYIQNLSSMFEKVKAELIGHYPIKETFVGNEKPSFLAIYRFSNKDKLNEVYGTDEYRNKMVPLRDKGFKNLEVYLG